MPAHPASCLTAPLLPIHALPPAAADSQGRVVSFKNTLIILTSNVGSSVIAKGGATVGFQLPTSADPEADQYGRVRTLVLEELKVGEGSTGGWGGGGSTAQAVLGVGVR